MSNRNKVVEVVEFRGKAEHLQNTIQSVRNSFDKISIPKELDKELAKMERAVGLVLQKTKNGFLPTEDFTETERELKKVKTGLDGLSESYSVLSRLSDKKLLALLPEDAKQKLENVDSAYKAYAQTLEGVVRAEKKLAEAEKKKKEAEAAAKTANSAKGGYAAAVTRAEEQLAKHKEVTEALNEQKEATDALAKAQKELDAAKATNKEKKIAEKQAVYDAADARKKNADTKVSGLDDAKLKAQAAAVKKLAEAEENYTVAKKRAHDAEKAKTAATVAAAGARTELLNAQNKNAVAQQQEEAALTRLRTALAAVNPEYKDMALEGDTAGEKLQILKGIIGNLSTQELAKFKVALGTTGDKIDDVSEALDGARDSLQKTGEVTRAEEEAMAKQQGFENRIKQFLGLSGAAQVLRYSVRDAMSTIKELDATMTEMAVVTDLTVGDYWNQLPQYSQQASDLGVSINEAYKAATLYYQQGLKGNEVTKISAQTLKMARIANLDAASATDKMTAALRGFNMELNEESAERIADVYSKLAAITAADTKEIANAMSKTASIASSAGMEFETTAAFLSQIIETTRESAETAGTALKTVIARFQELKKDPAEIGEVDGEIVDANKIETALRSVGVALRDSSGQFRDLDDVFIELSRKWDTLDTNTQRYIATIAAGSRQQSRFIAMMSDYGRTQDLVTAANNSAGASQQQFEKTMESLNAKVEKLKNTWHEFTMGIMDSKLVKAGVDILTKFLEVINKVTEGFNGAGSALLKIGTTLNLFKMGQNIFNKFMPKISSFFLSIVEQAGRAGEQSGQKFAEGVARAKTAVSQGTSGVVANVPFSGYQPLSGQVGLTEGQQGNKIMRLGAKAGNVFGMGHFQDMERAENNKKAAQAILGKDLATQQKNRETYKQNKEKLKNTNLDNDGKLARGADESDEAFKGRVEDYKKLTKSVEEYEKAENEMLTNSKTKWNSFSKGLDSCGQAISGLGLAVGAIGQAFTDAGLEEVGEVITGIGTGFMIAGTAMQFVSSLSPILSAAFGAAGAAGVTSGAATTAAWSVVSLIVLAVVAGIMVALAVVLLVFKAIENASPEKKLEQVQQAAAQAGEAADEAAASYEKLNSALENLEDKYKGLEELTEGTKEWNRAVQEINNSVLDLIAEYPELARLVKNEGGVLTLDINSAEVQDILQQAEATKVKTQNEANMMNAAVSAANNNVQYGNLGNKARVGNEINATWAGIGAGFGATLTGGGVGAGAGAGIGAATSLLAGPLAPLIAPITTGVGAIIGGVVGGIAGGGGGVAAGIAAKNAAEKNNEKVKQETDEVAIALAKGEILPTVEGITGKLIELGYSPEEAGDMAVQLANNADELREYGASLDATEAQQQAAYDAIAASAQGLANTLDMTAEQIQQSAVAVDGDIVEEYYEEEMGRLNDTYDDDKSLFQSDEALKAVRATYGENATLDKEGNVVYQKDGENKTVTLSGDQVKSMIATQISTDKTTKAIENSNEAISSIKRSFGSAGGKAIDNLYMASEGQALTEADRDELQRILGKDFDAEAWNNLTDAEKKAREDAGQLSQEVKDAWAALSPDQRLTFGDDITRFVDDLAEGVEFATDSFEKAGKSVRKFMTADLAQTFSNKLDEVAETAGGEERRRQIEDATDILLGALTNESGKIVRDENGEIRYREDSELDDEDRQKIQSRINMTDWSNIEELTALQLDLEYEYGLSAEAARDYVTKLADAAYATSGLTTTVKVFGDLWKITEKINQSLTKLNKLQWEYERALAGKGGSVAETTQALLDGIQTIGKERINAYNASNDEISTLYAQGADYKYDLRNLIELGAYGFDVDSSKLQDAVNAGVKAEDIQKWVDSINDQYTVSQSQIEGLRDGLDQIVELEQESKDAYLELRDMAKEALLGSLQEQIDLQRENLEITQRASSQLISKMQEQLNEMRQARSNEEAEKNIANLREMQSYLGMDTSDAHALELLDLEKQIADAEQSYRDTIVDQAIANLQKANEKAENQRDRQITLAESSLEEYEKSNEFQALIDQQLNEMLNGGTNWENSSLGKLLKDTFTEGMGATESKDWSTAIGKAVDQANTWIHTNWEGTTGGLEKALNDIESALGGLPDELTKEANDKVTSNTATEMSKLGFNVENIGYEKKADKTYGLQEGADAKAASTSLGHFKSMAKEDEGVENSDAYKRLMTHVGQGYKTNGTDKVMSRQEYYKTHSDSVANGEDVASYSEYVQNELNSADEAYQMPKSEYEEKGGMPIPMERKHWNNSAGSNFDLNVNDGGWDYNVENGNKIKGDSAFGKKLKEIMNNYPNSGNKHLVLANLDGTDRLYIRKDANSDTWYPVLEQGSRAKGLATVPSASLQLAQSYVNEEWRKPKSGSYDYKKYRTGGLADFTGPAWLDGTKSKPEIVLNQRDSANFMILRDILGEILHGSTTINNNTNQQKGGDNHFDIDINVDHIDNDYDVEQIADKIRNMIYDDATFRNVNTVSLM